MRLLGETTFAPWDHPPCPSPPRHHAAVCWPSRSWPHAGPTQQEGPTPRIRIGSARPSPTSTPGRMPGRSSPGPEGGGADRTACVSCHTGLSYALARPAPGRFTAGPEAGLTAAEERRIAAVGLRVEHWADLDSPRFGLMYDSDDRKKAESRGTEAVLNALLLARADAARGLALPLRRRERHSGTSGRPRPRRERRGLLGLAEFRSRALGGEQLTPLRCRAGRDRRRLGTGYLEPLDEEGSRHAIAPRLPPPTVRRGERFQSPLDPRSLDGPRRPADGRRPARSSTRSSPSSAKTEAGRRLSAASSASIAPSRPEDSDGYATGLALHVLLRAGLPAVRPELARGFAWIRTHQQPTAPGRPLGEQGARPGNLHRQADDRCRNGLRGPGAGWDRVTVRPTGAGWSGAVLFSRLFPGGQHRPTRFIAGLVGGHVHLRQQSKRDDESLDQAGSDDRSGDCSRNHAVNRESLILSERGDEDARARSQDQTPACSGPSGILRPHRTSHEHSSNESDQAPGECRDCQSDGHPE